MKQLPSSVDYLSSAAASAAKARHVSPVVETPDALDVATALKCMSTFQTLETVEELQTLEDEKIAAPLVAAARILQSTAQYRRKELEVDGSSAFDVGEDGSTEVDSLLRYAALAFAMVGNFPSARAALAAIETNELDVSDARMMVAFICDPRGACSTRLALHSSNVRQFLVHWRVALTSSDKNERNLAFDSSLKRMIEATMKGGIEDGALTMNAELAARQAMRLATVNLIEAAPEIPRWFVLNSIRSGTVTLLPPQRQLLIDHRIARHSRNTLLTLPTSTGKTFVAQACMVSMLEKGDLCVYVAPYVAIGDQVKMALQSSVGNELPIISMFGGFQLDMPSEFENTELIVATPERFDAWLRSSGDVARLKTVILDEIHIVENGTRGARVEGIVSRLRLLQEKNAGLRLVGLSAVLSEPERVCHWLSVADKDLHQIGWRPTARRLAICRSNGLLYWLHGNDALRPADERPNALISKPTKIDLPGRIRRGRFARMNEASSALNVAVISADLMERLGAPGLVVCPRKVDTRLLARVLWDASEDLESERLREVAENILARHPWLENLSDYIRRGIAYHNAALPFDVRRDIEELTRQRLLSVVCATTTLAEGADLPFRWTIVAHWLSSMADQGTPMKSMTFRNIAGRCGRAGAFSEGDTVLFENLMGPPSENQLSHTASRLERVMFSSAPLESTISESWTAVSEHSQNLISAAFSAQLLACIGENPDAQDIVETFKEASFAAHSGGEAWLKKILKNELADILDGGGAGGALAVANSPVRLTPLGEAANLSGFSPATCRAMVTFLQSEAFDNGPDLYAALLERFNNIPEQPIEKLRKIFSGANHRNPVRAADVPALLSDLLSGLDFRSAFDRLPVRKRSKASEDSVETQFEEFVSLVDGAVGNFLPWLLRGLNTLKEFGSQEASFTDWTANARIIEQAVHPHFTPELEDDSSNET